jgi:hypothetical protein
MSVVLSKSVINPGCEATRRITPRLRAQKPGSLAARRRQRSHVRQHADARFLSKSRDAGGNVTDSDAAAVAVPDILPARRA